MAEDINLSRASSPRIEIPLIEILSRIEGSVNHLTERVDAEFLSLRSRIQNVERMEAQFPAIIKDVGDLRTEITSIKVGLAGQPQATTLASLRDFEEVRSTIKGLNEAVVTRTEFKPVQMVVFGLVTLILIAVIGAVVGLVLVPA